MSDTIVFLTITVLLALFIWVIFNAGVQFKRSRLEFAELILVLAGIVLFYHNDEFTRNRIELENEKQFLQFEINKSDNLISKYEKLEPFNHLLGSKLDSAKIAYLEELRGKYVISFTDSQTEQKRISPNPKTLIHPQLLGRDIAQLEPLSGYKLLCALVPVLTDPMYKDYREHTDVLCALDESGNLSKDVRNTNQKQKERLKDVVLLLAVEQTYSWLIASFWHYVFLLAAGLKFYLLLTTYCEPKGSRFFRKA